MDALKKACALALSLALLLSGCTMEEASREFFAMDTVMSLTLYGGGAEEAALAVQRELYRLDDLLSVTNPEGDVGRLNALGACGVSDDTAAILSRARELHDLTGGAFDVTLYALSDLWGFYDGDYAIPDEAARREALGRTGGEFLSLSGNAAALQRKGLGVDLGAIAKGWASDRCAALVREAGIGSAMLVLGGNVYAVGRRPGGGPWNVAVADPWDASGYLGLVRVEDAAVVTSGAYQRYFEAGGVRYHHIMDPGTGAPADSGLVSVTVVSADGALADALSTALFVMGGEEAAAFWRANRESFGMILAAEDGRVIVTEGLEFSSDYEFEVLSP